MNKTVAVTLNMISVVVGLVLTIIQGLFAGIAILFSTLAAFSGLLTIIVIVGACCVVPMLILSAF